MCTTIRRRASENRATRSPLRHSGRSVIRSTTVRWWASQSKTERSDSWYSAAPERRTWQKDQSLHYLSYCVYEESHVVFRRVRQNSMAQTADPTGAILLLQRFKITD